MRKLYLVRPGPEHLPSYVDALRRGWGPDNTRLKESSAEQLAAIENDAAAFLATVVDRHAKGGPVTMPDGTKVARLPGYRLFLWDGEFAGSIGLRWQPGTTELPPHVLGHIGYSVVEWKRRRGYATEALRLMLRHARDEGLAHVILTTDTGNVPSQRVIQANGGVCLGEFTKTKEHGFGTALRWKIALD